MLGGNLETCAAHSAGGGGYATCARSTHGTRTFRGRKPGGQRYEQAGRGDRQGHSRLMQSMAWGRFYRKTVPRGWSLLKERRALAAVLRARPDPNPHARRRATYDCRATCCGEGSAKRDHAVRQRRVREDRIKTKNRCSQDLARPVYRRSDRRIQRPSIPDARRCVLT